VGAAVKASSQKGSASFGGSSGKATASTNIASSPLVVAGGERRQPLALALGEGTFHQPASGQGQIGDKCRLRRVNPLPQLAAEAEGGSGSESREGTWNRGNLPSTKPYVRRVRSDRNNAVSKIKSAILAHVIAGVAGPKASYGV